MATPAMKSILITAFAAAWAWAGTAAAQSAVLPQLQTDGQRMGGGGDAQLQSDRQRSELRQQRGGMGGYGNGMPGQGGAGMRMMGSGRMGAPGAGGYGDASYGAGVGPSLGSAAAIDAVNAAAGLANRAIVRGSGGPLPLRVDGDGIIRNDGRGADKGANATGRDDSRAF